MCERNPFKYKKVNLEEIDQQEAVINIEIPKKEPEEIILIIFYK